jgi:hypothetical protein
VGFKLLQFSPQGSSRVIRMRAIPEQWSGSRLYSTDSGFVQAWLEHEESCVGQRTNWAAISGLALSAVISAGFWTAVAVLIERIWK